MGPADSRYNERLVLLQKLLHVALLTHPQDDLQHLCHRFLGLQNTRQQRKSVIFNLKSFFTVLTTTNTKRVAGDLWMCCKANLSPAEMNKAISGPQQKIISSALYTAADTITAVLNRTRLLGEIAICFLMLVSPSTKININNKGRSFVAEKYTGSQGDLGIKLALGGLPKT